MSRRERRETKRKARRDAVRRSKGRRRKSRVLSSGLPQEEALDACCQELWNEMNRGRWRQVVSLSREFRAAFPDESDFWLITLIALLRLRDPGALQEAIEATRRFELDGELHYCAYLAFMMAGDDELAGNHLIALEDCYSVKGREPLMAFLPDREDLRSIAGRMVRLPDTRRRRRTAGGAGKKASPPRRPQSAPRHAAKPLSPQTTQAAPDRPVEGAAQPDSPQPAVPLLITRPNLSALVEPLLSSRDRAADAVLAADALDLLLANQYDRLLCIDAVTGVEKLPHQIEAVSKTLRKFHGRVLLADEVGLGKTIEAGLVLKEYLLRAQVRRALVLCPTSLVGQWKAELEEKFAITCITNKSSLFKNDPVGFWAQGPVIVASLGLARSARHREQIAKQKLDLVILDEAHHLKNRATRGYELATRIKSRYLLMLTATPVETNLTELYNLVTLLRPGTLGTLREFKSRFVSKGDPAAPTDVEALRTLLSDVMIRNTRATSGVRLPPRTARTVTVKPSPAEETAYQALQNLLYGKEPGRLRSFLRFLLEEAGSSPGAVARTLGRADLSRFPQAIAAELDRIAAMAEAIQTTAKMTALRQLLPGGKALVFTRFDATFDQLSAELGSHGIPFVPYRGGMAGGERDAAVQAFAGTVDVMLCSEVGGEGRNLQFCHRLINFDLPWNPMKIEQRIGRIHRIGQEEAVEIINLCAAGTIEERILDVLDRRINMFELIVGEMDLLLGDLEKEREFSEQVIEIYARAEGEEEVEKGFDQLAKRLQQARGRLERTRALDDALFGEDYADS